MELLIIFIDKTNFSRLRENGNKYLNTNIMNYYVFLINLALTGAIYFAVSVILESISSFIQQIKNPNNLNTKIMVYISIKLILISLCIGLYNYLIMTKL